MQKNLKDFVYFYQISRPLNLLIAFISFALGAFLANKHSFEFLGHLVFWVVGIGLVFIMAGGYWINDAHDFKIDKINKPERTIINAKLSVKKVVTAYSIVQLLVLFFVFAAASRLDFAFGIKLSLTALAVILLLFVYAVWLKRTSLAGNMLVAFLTAFVLMMAGFVYTFNAPLIWAAVFAFEINLIREIIKDIEDIEGDQRFGLKTLPIQAGIKNTQLLLSGLYILMLVSTWFPLFLPLRNLHTTQYPYLLFSLFFVQLPLLFLLRHLQHCQQSSDYSSQSRYLKWVMFAGMLSLLFLR